MEIYYVWENGEPVQAQRGDQPTHVLIDVRSYERMKADMERWHDEAVMWKAV